MDADPANDDDGRIHPSALRRTFPALWRALPWWERLMYALAILLFMLALIGSIVAQSEWNGAYLPVGWEQLDSIDSLLLCVGFPFFMAAIFLVLRRLDPKAWHEYRQVWSIWIMLVGGSVIFAIAAWGTITDLATPAGQIPPNLPAYFMAPFGVGGVLMLGGAVGAAPEIIIRKELAKRRQPKV